MCCTLDCTHTNETQIAYFTHLFTGELDMYVFA